MLVKTVLLVFIACSICAVQSAPAPASDKSKFCLNPNQYNGSNPSNYPGYTCDGFLGADAKMNAIDWSSDSAIQAACANTEVYSGHTRASVMNGMAAGSNPCCADLKSACYSDPTTTAAPTTAAATTTAPDKSDISNLDIENSAARGRVLWTLLWLCIYVAVFP